MYASAWIFVSAPMVVSFSTSEPRPMTTSSPTVTRSRTHAWSPTITRAPRRVPAKTIAPVETIVPSPSSAGGRSSRFAVERGDSVGCFPTTAPSRILHALAEQGSGIDDRARRDLCAHAGTPASDVCSSSSVRTTASPARASAWSPGAALDEPEEVAALELQRLVVRDPRAVLRARARLPLAVALRRLPRGLLVDRDLVLELHVVEDDHLVAADDGHPAHLVRVEPRQVHVRDLAGGEAQEAEDDVLHARRQERVPLGDRLARLLLEQVQDDREVVDAERPERVLVLADLAEVLAVAVDAEHVAELVGDDQLLQLRDGRVVEQQVRGHEHAVALRRERAELLHLAGAHRGRLLDHDVLAREQRALREVVVRGNRRRDHDRVEPVVGEHLVEVGCRARLRVAGGHRRAEVAVEVAEPPEVGQLVEVARKVRAPVAEARDCDARQSFQTLPSSASTPRVALRKSTTSRARRTTSE